MVAMARKNFHVPLPPETYDALREESEARGIPATTLVREAVEGWIDDQKAKRLRDEIAAYALEVAGTGADLDPQLEAAAAAELKAATERK
jgi:predicted DNA-binding protein